MLGRLDISLQGPKVGDAVLTQINEGSLLKIKVRPLDADLAAATPSSVRYRIDGINGQAIVGWTSVSPSTLMEILVTAAQNTLSSTCYSRDHRQVLIEASDSDGAIRETVDYDVVALVGA